jgi:hypothetical protein
VSNKVRAKFTCITEVDMPLVMNLVAKNILPVCVLAWLFAFSAPNDKDYTYKTIFIYNFIKYIEWPTENTDFTIAIYKGNSTIQNAFNQMAVKKSSATQSYSIKNISSLEETASAQILFIPYEQSDILEEAAAIARKKPLLIITEKGGLIEKGSGINFIVVDGKLRFELNRKVLEAAKLRVSSNLLNLAILN